VAPAPEPCSGRPAAGVPELLSDDPGGFAWGVLRERTPRLIAQVRDAHPYGPAQRRALDALLEEVTTGVVRPLGEHAHDHEAWDRWGAAYFGRRWAEVPFLWWESYFYRRLLDAVGFFEPGPWYRVDPFAYLKDAELHGAGMASDLAALEEVDRLPAGDRRQAKLRASVWGNQADLGFRIGATDRPDERARSDDGLVVDDSARLWAALDAGTANTVSIVADNAGREIISDLVLIDHLLTTGLAATVRLHLKPRPYYVSDATTADLVACLRRLTTAPGRAARLADRLVKAVGAGRLVLHTHAFHCAPWSFHHLPPDLAEEFAASSLTLLKGDLNYRRLVGDRAWPVDTPFADATAYFPSSVAALRTLKSDVAVGIDAATAAALDASGHAWRTSGTHGLVQVRV
jgi:hypothetical protein